MADVYNAMISSPFVDGVPPASPFVDSLETPAPQTQEVSEERKAHVKRVMEQVKDAKNHWKKQFDRMRDDIYFAEGNHWPDMIPGLTDDRLIIDVTTRHIQLRTAALYAKNPTITARRREVMDFQIWDEDINSLLAAQARITGEMPTMSPEMMMQDQALIQDVTQGILRRNLFERMGRTLEIIFRYSLRQMQPAFKTNLKDLIPRVITTGVAYLKAGYQRIMQKRPDTEHKLADATAALRRMETTLLTLQEDESA